MNKVVVLFGPPGSGKGTQADLLSKRLNMTHISTGNLLRNEISSGSECGKRIKDIVDKGQLVSDELILETLKSSLKKNLTNKNIFILDGVPRNRNQVFSLDALLKEFNLKVNKVIVLDASTDSILDRFSKRLTCKNCNLVISNKSNENIESMSCPKCNSSGTFYRRKDDEPETVLNRMNIYQQETSQVLKEYKDKDLIYSYDALKDVEELYVEISYEILK